MSEPTYTPPAPFVDAAKEVFSAPEAPDPEPEVDNVETETVASSAAGAGDSGTGAGGVSGEGAKADLAPSPTPTQPTAKEIADEVQRGLDARTTAPASVPQKEYTQDELDEMFKVWKPSSDMVEKLREGGDDAIKAMVDMRDGLLLQFNTMQDHLRQQLKEELMLEINPVVSIAKQQKADKDWEAFYTENPDLAGSKELVETVVKVLQAEKYAAKTIEEARKTLADRVRTLLPKGANLANGSTAVGSGQEQTTTQPLPMKPRPAQLSNGGQGGGGASTGNSATGRSVFQEIFAP